MAAIVVFNVQQEKVQGHLDVASMPFLHALKLGTVILRKQMSWLFVFSWAAVLLSYIPGFDQGGVMNAQTFRSSWAAFLPMTNVWMDVFLLSYVLMLLSGIYMNKYDSSFNMLSSNLSSVLALWTGWVPALMAGTVGFVPSVPLTAIAIVASLLAIYPSYKYSLRMRELLEHSLPVPISADETVGLLRH